MRAVTTDVAALALGVGHKVLDNVLTREARGLVGVSRRGKSRRISVTALERIAIALVLNRDLDVSVARGLALADQLAHGAVEVPVGSLAALRFDVTALRSALHVALVETLEEFVPPRRGRPPHQA